MNDYKLIFNQKFDAALTAQKFDKSLIDDRLQTWLYKALMYQTEYKLQCSWETFKGMIEKSVYDFNLLEMCNALNAIEYTTALQFDYGLPTYVEIKEVVKGLSAKWDEISAPIKEAIQKEVQELYEADLRKEAAKNKIVSGQPLPKKQIFH